MSYARQHLTEAREILDRLDADAVERVADVLDGRRARGGRLFVLGVGGSAANASHSARPMPLAPPVTTATRPGPIGEPSMPTACSMPAVLSRPSHGAPRPSHCGAAQAPPARRSSRQARASKRTTSTAAMTMNSTASVILEYPSPMQKALISPMSRAARKAPGREPSPPTTCRSGRRRDAGLGRRGDDARS